MREQMVTEDIMLELNWRVIPSLPTHEVSEYGDVRRCVDSRTYKRGWVHSQTRDKDGYKVVSIDCRPRWVHRLVAEAFIGDQPSKEAFQVNHIDGTKDNNHYTNLRWGTPKNNSDDMDGHGTRVCQKGEKHSQAKLTWEQVREIRKKRYEHKTKLKTLGEEYGVCFQLISLIVNRRIWNDDEEQ